ncbi:head GIN domain-containing protein [Abyssalbus ytuae]|uniref:DUF2807 domain-containing protein n=1 Tax=Abyssalbus ytuae TaxID=2926907 RepID=A0A9E6ZSW1_9FLAO|nr:head GIN domain-containing protein [Abyssalbus ytuae]UOB18243.1 DUF2807 domain-containing protein [Abyssalbus ytuae]
MKKTTVLILALLFALSAHSQWWGGKKIKGNGNVVTDERTTSDYDQINVAGSMDVELYEGREGRITVKAEENLLEYIITEVKGDKLVIKIKDGYSVSPSWRNTIFITVPFKDIEKVSLAGSGDVVTKPNNIIKTNNFNTSLAGSGDVKLEIEAKDTKASVAGSGDLGLIGSTQYFDCSVAGSGDIHAYELKAENVKASVAGSGDIRVYCDGTLKAHVAGSGDIRYQGNPKKEESKAVGSGSVSKG